MPKYQTGDIVIIHTHDSLVGNVHVPAVVRYLDKVNSTEHRPVYEVNCLIASDARCVEHVNWWTVTENEIEGKVGVATVENPK